MDRLSAPALWFLLNVSLSLTFAQLVMQAFCLLQLITEGFAFFIFGLDCSLVIRSCDVPSSSPWSHDLPKMAAAMADSMARLLTLGIVSVYSGSWFLG